MGKARATETVKQRQRLPGRNKERQEKICRGRGEDARARDREEVPPTESTKDMKWTRCEETDKDRVRERDGKR